MPRSSSIRSLAPAQRAARRAVAFTFAANGAVFGAWVPRIPDVKERVGLSDQQLGLALLAPGIGSLLAMTIAGALCARLGSQVVTRGAFVLFAAISWLPGVPSVAWLLWPALLLWGISFGSLDVAMNAQAVTVEKLAGRPILSGMHAAFSFGGLVGAGLGSAAIAVGLPLTAQQAILGAVALAVFLPASRAFRPDSQAPGSPGSEEAVAGRRPRRVSSRLVLFGVAALFALLCEGAAADWSGVLLRDDLDAAPAQAGLAFVAFSVTMFAGRLAGDRVVARFGRSHTLVVLAVVGIAGMASGLASGTVVGAIVGFGLLGIGLAVFVPVVFSAAADGQANAGPAIALVASFGYVGFLLGPSGIGQLAHWSDVATALWAIPVLLAVSAGLALLALRKSES